MAAAIAILGVPLALAQMKPSVKDDSAAKAKSLARMQRDSQSFVENKGQWNPRAKFLSRTKNLDLWVTGQGLVLDYYRNTQKNHVRAREGHAIDMRFLGANKRALAVGEKKGHVLSQYLGPHADFKHAKTAKSYGEAWLKGVYPGVDMRVYVQDDRPRYDLEVAPHASAGQIRAIFKGADHVRLDKKGNLLIPSKLGDIQQQGLYAYQIVNGEKKQVEAGFSIVGSNIVAYHLGAYDHSKKLVIDPLIYGSYYGGDGGLDEVRALVADADSGVFMTGLTASADFPLKLGAYINLNGLTDGFITKFEGDAYSIDFASYFGGSGNDTGKFIGLDPTGNNVWVAGMTTSTDFPGIGGSSFQSTFQGPVDAFLIEFTRDTKLVLVPTYSTYFHSNTQGSGEEIKGFAVSGITGNLFLAGNTTGGGLPSANNSYPTGSPQAGYIISFDILGQNVLYSTYVGASAGVSVGFPGIMPAGLTNGSLLFWNQPNPPTTLPDLTSAETGNAIGIDQADDVYITGTVVFQGNQDTATDPNPAFVTTPGVFVNGRLLRNNDGFLVKYDSTGNVLFSTLIGGADNDAAFSVAVDKTGNAYVTGVTGSFDFPRTHGTFGQDFSTTRCYVTKVSQDGSTIVWSTGLNTVGNVVPTGIAVDGRGFVFITGEIFDLVRFPFPPTDPWEPNAQTLNPGSVPTTTDALRSTYEYPTVNEMSSSDAWFMVLNDTASTEVYGTYIGGIFDDYAYSPYVDRFGDCWVMGWTDSLRSYTIFSSTGVPKSYPTSQEAAKGPLSGNFITPLAFKNVDKGGGDFVDEHFGDYAENLLPTGASPPTFGMFRARDGFVMRFRIDLPIIKSLVLTPATIPGGPNGGGGATSTGTITLNIPATGPGVDVNVTLSDLAPASLDPTGPVGAIVVNIPAGQTVGTFTIYSNEVSTSTPDDVKAEFLGNFQIARLTVVPWLQKFALSPSTTVGGNSVNGVVTLAAPAPKPNGLDIQLITNDPNTILLPGGNLITVPAGQSFANFVINTKGVDTQTDFTVAASALSVGITQKLTLKTANLLSVSFSPGRVAGGSKTTGTVHLDGLPGPTGFSVALSINPGTAGYSFDNNTLNFGPTNQSLDFQLTTAPELVNTQRVVTATRAATLGYLAESKTGTIFVDANFLTNLSINPSTVKAGDPSVGTVTISNTAEPGGVVVNLLSDTPTVASVPASVIVPAGSTQQTFPIATYATAIDTTVTIHAIRGATNISRTLLVQGVAFTMSAQPISIIGGPGNIITGKVTLPLPAPNGGVLVSLSSNNTPAATVPVNVTVPAGQTFVTFPITTYVVATTQNAKITGQTQPNTTASVTVQIRAISLASIVFTPSFVKGGTFTHVVVTLDAPAPNGGATVTMQSSNPAVLNPGPITILAGHTTSASIPVLASRVNRTLAVTITGQFNGRQIATTVTVFR